MAEEDTQELARQLKEKGLTCPSLKSRIKKQQKDSQDFSKLGFSKLADTEKAVADQLKELYRKVCRKI